MHFLIDGHSHFMPEQHDSLYRLLEQYPIKIVFSCGHLNELSELQAIKQDFPQQVYLSLGVHPWHSDTEQLIPFFEALAGVDMLGEVGLDSVWCKVPLAIQQRVFEQQIHWAKQWNKPLVLHTKGQESRIAKYLAQQALTGPILVHWYSGNLTDLLHFKALDCYFSIGPDVGCNPNHAQILRYIERKRIITETDGLAAIAWAKGADSIADYLSLPQVLLDQLRIIAEAWDCTLSEAQQQVAANFNELLNAPFAGAFSH